MSPIRTPAPLRLAVGLWILALALAAPRHAEAVTIQIVNRDGASEGFNDPTPAAPAPGNPGTTLGAQRLFVFQVAADLWSALLPGETLVQVEAYFDALQCTGNSVVLGRAGPKQVYADFDGAPIADTWYHASLANRLSGRDLSASEYEILAIFNSALDGSCLGSVDWYYGTDGIEGTDVDLLPVVLHELGHGLGFSSFVDLENDGSLLNGLPDVFTRFILDTSTGQRWSAMTSSERLASAARPGQVVWDGAAVTARTAAVLSRPGRARVVAPVSIARTLSFAAATFGPSLRTPGLTAEVVRVDDGTGITTDACSPIVNAAALAGKIALIDRGACAFVDKVAAAQAAGAIAAVIVNNQAGAPPTMTAVTDPGIAIPSIHIGQSDGDAIKAELGAGVTLTLDVDPAAPLAGADAAGRALLYAPNPIELGSSISHWDISATPNLLMEPYINSDLTATPDLASDLFQDLGWFGIVAPPPVLRLAAVVPNPFAASVRFDFETDSDGELDFAIHDLQGRRVRQLFHGFQATGSGQVTWDGADDAGARMPPGVYLCQARLGGAVQTRRLVLMP